METLILLLDVDGVLVHARGYWASVRATVEYFAGQMGQPHITGPDESQMRAFEAENIISEWDSAAVSVAALLASAPPALLSDDFETTLAQIAAAGVTLPQPDYAELAHRLPKPTLLGQKPAHAALGAFFPDRPPFQQILAAAHRIESPITQVFQQHTLGSEQYFLTYGLKPQIESESLLLKHDEARLSPEMRDRLLEAKHVKPVIYTARPSLPPTFETDWHGYPPEAELARKVVGLNGVPLVGYGHMQWLAQQEKQVSTHFVKPAIAHALAAIYTALLGDQDALPLHSAACENILQFEQPLRVAVCEDSSASIRGVKAAAALLGIPCQAVGVADSAVKAAALTHDADLIVDNINVGLTLLLG